MMIMRAERAVEYVECDGLRVAYERAGRGPPVVLLHGYVGDGVSTWRRQIDALADEFTVVAWDAPGAGRSADPPESFGVMGYADCLARFISELGLERPHVVGLSFGGTLAIAFAARHAAVPRTLVLASAYAGWAGSLPVGAAEQRLSQALQLADFSADDFVGTLLPTMFSASTPAAVVEEFGVSLRNFHPRGFRALADACAGDLRPALSHIVAPTLLLYGDNDLRAPLEVAEALHAAIKDSTLVLLPGVGHCCNIEAPEDFNREVRDFLLAQNSTTP
jgi:pimeloyl-ACP methyl ester carboxylesterase